MWKRGLFGCLFWWLVLECFLTGNEFHESWRHGPVLFPFLWCWDCFGECYFLVSYSFCILSLAQFGNGDFTCDRWTQEKLLIRMSFCSKSNVYLFEIWTSDGNLPESVLLFLLSRNKHMGSVRVPHPQTGNWPHQLPWCGEADYLHHDRAWCWGWGDRCWRVRLRLAKTIGCSPFCW